MTRFLSVCSGIEAASVAFAPLGWQAVGFAEIERFPSEVLAHHYGSNMPGLPLATNGVPNFGDFTTIPLGEGSSLGRVDLLVGGTPCQAFSVAGKRGSLADARGNLTLAFVELAHGLVEHHGLRNALWENVHGVLSTDDNAFGCFLGGLVGSDAPLDLPRGIERWPDAGMVSGPRARAAWRVLDAQYFGLAQRRRRVFVVVDFGNGADPVAVLFERQGLRRNPPARGEAGEGTASDAGACAAIGGAGDIAGTVSSKWAKGTGGPAGDEVYNLITHALRGEGFDASEDGTGRGTPIVPVCFSSKDFGADAVADLAPTLRTTNPPAVAFDLRGRAGGAMPEGPHDTANLRAASGGSSRSYLAFDTMQVTSAGNYSNPKEGDPCHPLAAGAHPPAIANLWAVRRLTPRECARLQGFPDDYLDITVRGKPAADGPKYKAIGNSWAVPVVRWIGERIDLQLREGEAA